MTASDTTALAIAALASVGGALAVVGMWRRSSRQRRRERARHPSVHPPLVVDLADDRHLRLTVRPGAPPVSVDIVSYRSVQPEGAWEEEPIVDPIRLQPGGWVVLSATFAGGTAADVVVAWTAHHPTGDVPGSRLFRIPTVREEPPDAAAPRLGLTTRAALPLLALVAVAGAVVGWAWVDHDGTTSPDVPSADTEPDDAAVASSTTVAAPPATGPPPSAETTLPATTMPDTTAVPTTSVAVEPTSTSVAPTVPVEEPPPGSPRVLVEGRIAPCRFGDECLVVGFVLDGFTTSPQEYVCEFADGSRFTFRFDSGGVTDACSTVIPGESITVEVEGVRSVTITRDDVVP